MQIRLFGHCRNAEIIHPKDGGGIDIIGFLGFHEEPVGATPITVPRMLVALVECDSPEAARSLHAEFSCTFNGKPIDLSNTDLHVNLLFDLALFRFLGEARVEQPGVLEYSAVIRLGDEVQSARTQLYVEDASDPTRPRSEEDDPEPPSRLRWRPDDSP